MGLLTEGSRRSSSPSYLHRPIVEVSSPGSPSGEVLGAGSVNKKWGVGKSEPREHRVDDWEPWTGSHGNRFSPPLGLRAALSRPVTCPSPGLCNMTSGVTVSPQERILSFMLDLKVEFKGVKTYNLKSRHQRCLPLWGLRENQQRKISVKTKAEDMGEKASGEKS